MKIVHVCLGGIFADGWTYQENILPKYHVKAGHEVTVITHKWVMDDRGGHVMTDRINYINADGVKIIRLALKNNQGVDYKFKRAELLYETLDKEKPDILFSHGFQYLDIDILVRYLKKNYISRVYVDSHADFSLCAKNWLSKNILHGILWRHYAMMINPYVTKFYGVLPARVDFLKKVYRLPEEKCELLILGADDEMVKDALKQEARKQIRHRHGIAEDDFLIMTGGKIDSAKWQTLILMEAVSQIKNPKAKLLIFGSVVAELKARLNDLCIADKIIYVGWINPDDTYKYFAAANLVVFPGRHSVFWEQVTGLGIPMICKYWEGTTHVDLGGNVQFLKEDSVELIYEKINGIINNPEIYRHMKAVAVEKGMERFSYEQIARQSIL